MIIGSLLAAWVTATVSLATLEAVPWLPWALYGVLALAFLLGGVAMAAPPSKPNIVVIWGDDVGFTNLSVYSRGVMGYRTPNIDRIANEGAVFTDHYAHPSCTAG